MESTFWYLIAFCGICAACCILWILKLISPNLRRFFVRHIALPLLFKRRRWWDSITRLDACLILLLFLVNFCIVFWPIGFDWKEAQRRSAFAAAVNMVPLCLGGRLGPVVQVLNIHRSLYLLFHHWLGRIAILEAFAHALIALLLRPQSGPLLLSGWITLGTLLGTLISSLCVMRILLGRWFLLQHRLITLASVATLLWHVLRVSKLRTQIVVGLGGGLWVLTTLYRVFTFLYHRYRPALVQNIKSDSALTKINVALYRPVRRAPGKYFHVFFPGKAGSFNFLYSYPAVAHWPLSDTSSAHELSHLSFVFSRRGAMAEALSRLQEGDRVLLDGPYGRDLRIHNYDNIILAAKGIGIVGVLPYALELSERRQHDNRVRAEIQSLTAQQKELLRDEKNAQPELQAAIASERQEVIKKRHLLSEKPLFRDATKTIIIFWALDSNSQIDLVADELSALQRLDPENQLLVVWIGYPDLRHGDPPFALKSTFWMCLDPGRLRRSFESLIASKIREERRKLQGRMIVTTCGGSEFTNMIRRTVYQNADGMDIDFAETEYRPPGNLTGRDHQISAALKRRRGSNDTELRDLTAGSSAGSLYSVALD